MTMKMSVKKKNTSRKYDINRPRPRHAHECTKCKNLGWFKTMISYIALEETPIRQSLDSVSNSVSA